MIASEREENAQFAELSLDFGRGFGVTVCGTYDAEDHFHMDHYFPYLEGRNVTTREESVMCKHSGEDSFGVLCEDYRLGVSLIFYLQNSIEFMRCVDAEENAVTLPVRISCLCNSGKILLPTAKTKNDILKSADESSKQIRMITEAKNGNQDAIEKLAIKELDAMTDINNRIRTEDVFSIVDTSFIPHGIDSEVYKILGIILSVEERVNMLTEEVIYAMEIYCNNMLFDLCINKEDLMGEPQIGRRIRATAWLQGHIDFPK